MFTRVVEVKAKSGKARELAKTIPDKALPILREEQGFVDEVVLQDSIWQPCSSAESFLWRGRT